MSAQTKKSSKASSKATYIYLKSAGARQRNMSAQTKKSSKASSKASGKANSKASS
jgi:hypothetical protein